MPKFINGSPRDKLLFHVSPRKNRESLLRHGIDPAKSRGRHKRIWLAGHRKLVWAIMHIAKHHRCCPDSLEIFVCHVPKVLLRKLRNGVYICHQRVMVHYMFPATELHRYV